MDIAERTTAERPSGSASFDGFISYSHAADDLLAPRLQAGLQRFAKPWWKRRAVRIFRDESSLAANPHLWSSITQALDDSSWFVLLLSEDAASSEWVGREIEHWIEHKPADRILPVVTDGTFGWENGDVTGTSVPPALHGVFGEEPRWVDLRFARDEESLDLQNPDFSAAVADIAATIRGVPKDELASEEVKQHRRTVRTAWAAGISVTVLAVAALVAGVFAIGQRNDARDAQDLAEQNATLAQQNADRAETEADRANQNAEAEAQARSEAEDNATLARSRELAATALEVVDEDPQLATLLALESIDVAGTDPPGFLVDVVWEAALANRLVTELRPGDGEFAAIDLSSDGSLLVATDNRGAVAMYRAPDGDLLWSLDLGPANQLMQPAFHPDGDRIAVSIADAAARFYPGAPASGDPRSNQVMFFSVEDGSELGAVEYPNCLSAYTYGWSPDGSVLPVSSGWDACPREGTSGMWLELIDGETLEPIRLIDTPTLAGGGPIEMNFSNEGDLLVSFWPGDDPILLEAPGYVASRTLEGLDGNGSISPDGTQAVTFSNGRPKFAVVFDTETGRQRDVLEIDTFVSPVRPFSFSSDGLLLAISSEGRDTLVYDMVLGKEQFRLPGGSSAFPTFGPDGRWLYTGHGDGTIKIWDLGARTLGQRALGGVNPGEFVNGEFSVGPNLGVGRALSQGEDGSFESRLLFFDVGSGEIVADATGANGQYALADGRFVIIRGDVIYVHDPISGSEVPIGGCESEDGEVCIETGEPIPPLDFAVSIDGTELMFIDRETGEWFTASLDDGSTIEQGSFALPGEWPYEFSGEWILSAPDAETWVAVDRATGKEIARLAAGDMRYRAIEADLGSIVGGRDGELTLIDLEDWTVETATADFDRVRGLALSPSGRLLAVGGENVIVIVDVGTREQLRVLPVAGTTDYHWLDEETVLVGGGEAQWFTVSLDPGDLAAEAASGLTRSFSDRECATYRIDPCPTLEELANG